MTQLFGTSREFCTKSAFLELSQAPKQFIRVSAVMMLDINRRYKTVGPGGELVKH